MTIEQLIQALIKQAMEGRGQWPVKWNCEDFYLQDSVRVDVAELEVDEERKELVIG